MLHIYYAAVADKARRVRNCSSLPRRPEILLTLLLIGASVLAFAASAAAQPVGCWVWSPVVGRWIWACGQPQAQPPYDGPPDGPQQPYDGPPAAPLPPPSQQPSQGIGGHIYTEARPWGGSYIFIKGEIVPGDDQTFESLHPPEPVFVRPIGPGGDVGAALGIADTIAQRGYSTLSVNADGLCGSACATIWLSGYAHHAIAQSSAVLGFHSCSKDGQDDMQCDFMIAEHLVQYGFTKMQAWALVGAAPHQGVRWGDLAWAQSLGFRWQTIRAFRGAEDYCTARLCIAVP